MANLEFIMEKMSSFYHEVISMKENSLQAQKLKWMGKALCGDCGKQFMNKKGVKQHILRMHVKNRIIWKYPKK